jgi:hypothetical protein
VSAGVSFRSQISINKCAPECCGTCFSVSYHQHSAPGPGNRERSAVSNTYMSNSCILRNLHRRTGSEEETLLYEALFLNPFICRGVKQIGRVGGRTGRYVPDSPGRCVLEMWKCAVCLIVGRVVRLSFRRHQRGVVVSKRTTMTDVTALTFFLSVPLVLLNFLAIPIINHNARIITSAALISCPLSARSERHVLSKA